MCEWWDLFRGLWVKGARDKLSSFGLGISCGPKGKIALPYLHCCIQNAMAGGRSSCPAKIGGVSSKERCDRGREGRGEVERILWSAHQRRMRREVAGIREGGGQQRMGRKAGSGSSGRRCPGNYPATGRSKTDSVRCRNSCGGTDLFQGRLDTTNRAAGGSAPLRAVSTVFST
jgi:hypothetical protein